MLTLVPFLSFLVFNESFSLSMLLWQDLALLQQGMTGDVDHECVFWRIQDLGVAFEAQL
jgi:hypothetical protein